MNHVNRRISNLPSDLAALARRVLDAAGYVRLQQLASVSEAESTPLHGIGLNALNPLRRALAAKRLFLDGSQET